MLQSDCLPPLISPQMPGKFSWVFATYIQHELRVYQVHDMCAFNTCYTLQIQVSN